MLLPSVGKTQHLKTPELHSVQNSSPRFFEKQFAKYFGSMGKAKNNQILVFIGDVEIKP